MTLKIVGELFARCPDIAQQCVRPGLYLEADDLHFPDTANNFFHTRVKICWMFPWCSHLLNIGQDTAPLPVKYRRYNGDLGEMNDLKANAMITILVAQPARVGKSFDCSIQCC